MVSSPLFAMTDISQKNAKGNEKQLKKDKPVSKSKSFLSGSFHTIIGSKDAKKKLFKKLSFDLKRPPIDEFKKDGKWMSFGYFRPNIKTHGCYNVCSLFLKKRGYYISKKMFLNKETGIRSNWGFNAVGRECYQQCLCSYDWSKRKKVHTGLEIIAMCNKRKKENEVFSPKEKTVEKTSVKKRASTKNNINKKYSFPWLKTTNKRHCVTQCHDVKGLVKTNYKNCYVQCMCLGNPKCKKTY